LAYSKSLAGSSGGELRLVRAGPGAVFELSWPVGDEQSGARPSDVPAQPLGQLRVLVLEDDPAVVSLIEVALGARGADVVAASSLSELRSLQNRGFDAILVDLSPISADVMLGLREIRDHWVHAPIVLITGTAVALPDGAEEQLAAWVRKPFDMSEIVDVLAELLGH
jgi:DNA-binding NtrC family response regulator